MGGGDDIAKQNLWTSKRRRGFREQVVLGGDTPNKHVRSIGHTRHRRVCAHLLSKWLSICVVDLVARVIRMRHRRRYLTLTRRPSRTLCTSTAC